MSQITKNFIKKVSEQFYTGHAREHSYRPALEEFFKDVTGLKVVNEPKRSEYGAPDFVFLDKSIVTAYAEAKDLNVALEEIEKSEQMIRYYGYSNLILTNCLEFRFYRNGKAYVEPIKIALLENNKLNNIEVNYVLLEDTVRDFIKESKEPIKSGIHLAKVMAGKARRIRDNINIFLADSDNEKNENLLSIYGVIKKLLLADLDITKFADMYAQTVVYGLFAARYSDKTPDTFSRQEARDLVPSSNPFLKHFFDHIAGSSFDPRIEVIVNELCEEFNHADVQAIVHNYYKVEKDDSRDPIIHFYEDFLQEYDSTERKKMGVFYTPLPVVRFIIRAIDDILKKDFKLPLGLTDTTKIDKEVAVQADDARYKDGVKKVKQQFHKVQILDPATGTGTFLNETFLYIKESFDGQEGRWKNYVKEELLPRLHGFELMMASYTIAHLKLSSTIKESGADLNDKQRLGVYLTNSLEKGERAPATLFDFGLSKAITEESNQANKIKNEMPIMVIMGNPPYNISSQNKGEYISELLKEYKKNLNERKTNLDDDYIKFIRFTENIIEQNGEGIIGMITNNSFIDGVTHRQMRKHLLEVFDSIYILDLHGNSKKKEISPDGNKDENIFNIMQGVSISIFVKIKGKKDKKLANVYHSEIYGARKEKFESLNISNIQQVKWNKLDYKEPYYFFVPKDFSAEEEYKKGFKINEIFITSSAGIKTKVDNISIDFSADSLRARVKDIIDNKYSIQEIILKFNLNPKTTWEYSKVLKVNYSSDSISLYDYRPFDSRYIYYDHNFLSRSRSKIMNHFFQKDNIGLETSRVGSYIFLSNKISDEHFISDNSFKFPLYTYLETGVKMSNLNKEIVADIEKIVGKTAPEDILDYIYTILHSPIYRNKYKEFLKIDFPRLPYPESKEKFFKLVKIGRELRSLHLMESAVLNKFITTYPESGDDIVEKKFPKYKDNKVYINNVQYFGNVPEVAYNLYIGSYQPAQKWLKDRQGLKLTNNDIEHYQKIIISLTETDRIMQEIDKIL